MIASRKRKVPLLAVAVGAVLSSCAVPAKDDRDYAAKAGHSAQVMIGIVQTARYAADLRLAGRLPGPTADTVVSTAEQDAQSVITSFDSRQPPVPESDKRRQAVDSPLQDAGSDLTDLRVALRMGERPQVRQLVRQLARIADALQPFTGQS